MACPNSFFNLPIPLLRGGQRVSHHPIMTINKTVLRGALWLQQVLTALVPSNSTGN